METKTIELEKSNAYPIESVMSKLVEFAQGEDIKYMKISDKFYGKLCEKNILEKYDFQAFEFIEQINGIDVYVDKKQSDDVVYVGLQKFQLKWK